MKFFSLIWKNAFRKRTRAVLTISSVVLVLVLIVVVVSLLESMKVDPSGGKGSTRLIVQNAAGLGDLLPLSQRQQIERVPGVVAVTPQIWFAGIYKDDRPENFFGQVSCDPDVFFTRIFDDASIEPSVNATFRTKRNSFVAGKLLEDKFHWKKGDRITLRGTYIPVTLDLEYAGHYRAGAELDIFFSNELLNRGQWPGAGKHTGFYYVRVARPQDIPGVIAAIDSAFENSGAPTRTMTEKQFQLQFLEMMGNVKALVYGITTIMLFAVALIVANTVAMSARERETEIAVMRTLGFQPSHILWLVLSESVLISVLGALAGVVLARWVFVPLILSILEHSRAAAFVLNFRVSPGALLQAAAFSLGIGAAAGFLPAIRASRSSIAIGLRKVV
jgi:putative ABC transport system permease protein